MSPILVRPVREQLEHDRIIRLLQTKHRRKYEAGINPGAEQSVPVGTGPSALYPDVVLTSQDRGHKLDTIIEVETGESVNHLEALAQWVHYGKLRAAFHLYVPSGMVDVARRLCEDSHVHVTELWSYHTVGDDVRFTLVQRSREAAAPPRRAWLRPWRGRRPGPRRHDPRPDRRVASPRRERRKHARRSKRSHEEACARPKKEVSAALSQDYARQTGLRAVRARSVDDATAAAGRDSACCTGSALRRTSASAGGLSITLRSELWKRSIQTKPSTGRSSSTRRCRHRLLTSNGGASAARSNAPRSRPRARRKPPRPQRPIDGGCVGRCAREPHRNRCQTLRAISSATRRRRAPIDAASSSSHRPSR